MDAEWRNPMGCNGHSCLAGPGPAVEARNRSVARDRGGLGCTGKDDETETHKADTEWD